MMMTPMMPVMAREAPKSVAPKATVRFGNTTEDSAQAQAFVGKLETALASGVRLSGIDRLQNCAFFTVDGQTYQLKGLFTQVFAGGPPASYTIANLATGESARYVGSGCFSGPSGRYSSSNTDGNGEILSMELTFRLEEVVGQLENQV